MARLRSKASGEASSPQAAVAYKDLGMAMEERGLHLGPITAMWTGGPVTIRPKTPVDPDKHDLW